MIFKAKLGAFLVLKLAVEWAQGRVLRHTDKWGEHVEGVEIS